MSTLDALTDALAAGIGMAPRPAWAADLARAAVDLTRSMQCSPEELVAKVGADRRLLLDLAGHVSVPESYFFRYPEHFAFLTAHAARVAPSQTALTVLSLGCAGGEEPYSVAIALDAAGMLEPVGGRSRVLACDVNQAALAKAEAAVYGPWSFRGGPPIPYLSYFDPTVDGAKRLAKRVCPAVTFTCTTALDFLAVLPSGGADVVFFRNVAIYLEQQAFSAIVGQIARVLREGGVLFMSPTDPPPPEGALARAPAAPAGVFLRSPNEGASRNAAGSPAKPAPRPPTAPATVPADQGVARRARTRRPAAKHAPAMKSSPVAAAPAPAGQRAGGALAELAAKLGDQGEITRAMAALEELGARDWDAALHALRGKLHLAASEADAAVGDLRRAVFLDPASCLARFWYATALGLAGQAKQSRAQLEELCRRLAAMDPASVLEDGETRAAALLAAARFAKEEME